MCASQGTAQRQPCPHPDQRDQGGDAEAEATGKSGQARFFCVAGAATDDL